MTNELQQLIDHIQFDLSEEEISEVETVMIEFQMPNPREQAIEILVNKTLRRVYGITPPKKNQK